MEEQPDSVQLDTKADAVRIVDTLKRMPDMVRAKVDFGGEMNIRNSKMAEIEKTAAANAERNGTGAGTEKQKLVDGILKDEGAGWQDERHGGTHRKSADPPDEHLLPAVQDGI